MDNIFDRLIRLNIRLEGALRVAADRQSPEAVDEAARTFEAMKPLFAQLLTPAAATEAGADEATTVKCEEAVNAENDPEPEPDTAAVPDAPVVESDSEAEAEAEAEAKAPATAPAAGQHTRTATDLRKMFTLNDTFLFRRELFGGDNAEMTDTLELIASMRSLDEVEEYVYDDLQWNPEDDNVSDFMCIVSNFFSRD